MKVAHRFVAAMLTALLIPAGTVRSQEARPAGGEGMWRFVDSSAVAVARVDLAAYDRQAVRQWLADLVRANSDEQTAARVMEDLKRGTVFDQLADALKPAGVKEVYGVASLAGIPTSFGLLDVPLPAGADPDRVARALFAMFGRTPLPAGGAVGGSYLLRASDQMYATVVGADLIVSAGDPAQVQHVVAADRPDLKAAFARGNGAPLVIAVAPNADTRKVIEQMLPRLPQPLDVPSTVLTHGVRWAQLSGTFPPKASLSVEVQSDNADAARDLDALVERVLGMARANPGFRAAVKDADKVMDLLTPKVEGDRLVLSLDAADAQRVAGMFASGLTRAVDQQRRVKSMSNLREIGQGIMLYANEHKGALPDKLDQLGPYFEKPGELREVLTNPQRPDRQPGYVYVKPRATFKDLKNAQELPAAYEAFDQWPADGAAVLFADGHVEWVSQKDRFEKLVPDAKASK